MCTKPRLILMRPLLVISEDAPLDSLVGNFYQTSGDSNVSVSYQIEGASNQIPFAIVGRRRSDQH